MGVQVINAGSVNLFIPPSPYKLRTNCKMGLFGVGDMNNFENAKVNGRGKWIDVAIVDTKGFYGDLGLTTDADWLQVWFVVIDSEKNESGKPYLAPGLLAVTMFKRESADNLTKAATELEISAILDGAGAEGFGKVFRLGFAPRSGQYGDYFAITATYRDPESDAEKEYVAGAYSLMLNYQHALVDNDTTKAMSPKTFGDEPPALVGVSVEQAALPAASGKTKAKAA